MNKIDMTPIITKFCPSNFFSVILFTQRALHAAKNADFIGAGNGCVLQINKCNKH